MDKFQKEDPTLKTRMRVKRPKITLCKNCEKAIYQQTSFLEETKWIHIVSGKVCCSVAEPKGDTNEVSK
jgi:hypothetical protein